MRPNESGWYVRESSAKARGTVILVNTRHLGVASICAAWIIFNVLESGKENDNFKSQSVPHRIEEQHKHRSSPGCAAVDPGRANHVEKFVDQAVIDVEKRVENQTQSDGVGDVGGGRRPSGKIP